MRQTVTAAVDVRPATVAELREHGGDLFAASWAEIQGEGDLCVDWGQYEALEGAGLLLTWAAWVDGEMVGYSVAAVLPSLHTSDFAGELLSMFVKPEHRRLGFGRQLIRITQAAADERGVKMRWRAKRWQALDVVLRRMGYDETEEVVYVKRGAR